MNTQTEQTASKGEVPEAPEASKFTRVSWDIYFMRLAYATAMRASCPRKQVGALVVRPDRRIVASGYNGAPRGMPSCDEAGCVIRVLPGGKPEGSCVRTLHAESNALELAGSGAHGCTLYVSCIPCRECAMRIVQAGITRVCYHEFYDSRGSHESLSILQGPNAHLYNPRVQVVQMQGPVEAYRGTYAKAPA
jgi:dCMP deaminase